MLTTIPILIVLSPIFRALNLGVALQVEEKRTPLQVSMDELAQKLSFISFAIIGIIVLIGVFQKRSWLEMFTIGGQSFVFECEEEMCREE